MKGVEAVFDHVKPLNSCADAACSGDCWYHKSDRLFKCFVPTGNQESSSFSGAILDPVSDLILDPELETLNSSYALSDLSCLYSILFIFANL